MYYECDWKERKEESQMILHLNNRGVQRIPLIGGALTFFARVRVIFFSATPNFRLFGVALRIRCGDREFRLS